MITFTFPGDTATEESLGPTPCDEPCQQVGTDAYCARTARQEAARYADELTRVYPPPPGCRLQVRRCPHDFGTYHDVVAVISQAAGERDASWDWLEAVLGSPSTWAGLAALPSGQGD